MNFVKALLLTNRVLTLCICSWLIAQILKGIIELLHSKKVAIQQFLGSGGMPRTHSAVGCSCAVSVGLLFGWGSPYFAIAAVLAFVVMYDAANVRKQAGEQGKILNFILQKRTELRPDFYGNGKALKELLGHTPLQVLVGAILGIVIAIVGVNLLALLG